MNGARGLLLGMIVGKVIVGLVRYGKAVGAWIKNKTVSWLRGRGGLDAN